MESGLEERRREEEVSARLQQLIQVQTRNPKIPPKKGENNFAPPLQLLESVVELNSGLEEREEETHRLSGQVGGNFFLEPADFLAKVDQTLSQFQVEKAVEELEEAERQEVEAEGRRRRRRERRGSQAATRLSTMPQNTQLIKTEVVR